MQKISKSGVKEVKRTIKKQLNKNKKKTEIEEFDVEVELQDV